MKINTTTSRFHSSFFLRGGRSLLPSSPFSATKPPFSPSCHTHLPLLTPPPTTLQNPNFSSSACHLCHRVFNGVPCKLAYPYSITSWYFNTSSSEGISHENQLQDETDEEVEPIDSWEEEDEADPEIGDGGDGGGVVLQNCSWGEQALHIAREVLLQFGDDMKLYAFKTSPRGYIYVRLDKLSNEYGCPSMDEIETYSQQYKKRLDKVGAMGEIPDDLALEVSSPGAERLIKVPDDLDRFKDMPMRVNYMEDVDAGRPEKNGVFFLESVETESGSCVWKLADVKENREPSAKGRPLSRKQKDWRLKLPYEMFSRVTLYLDY
ncbi:unnamed protein product [Ilex paraguariensis]|uniref:Ribosome maturation factor RimP N-terminal domain-containing protein n=1 Tax=Ilex paraguariensis TaxID=185542 RepID=A0ABC8UYU3_9AQUA